MAINVGSRLKRAWNAFTNRAPPGKNYYGGGSSYRPDRVRLNRANDRTIMTAIYTRIIAMDAAGITINHVRLDENGRYDETVDSGLNCCLNLSGNKDQTGRALRYDMFLSVLDEGVAALVPVEHPAVEGVEEVSHYETVAEYPGGGRDVRKVIDVPGVPAQAAWTEQVPVQRYIRYTEEELAAREKERQQAEEAARLPETIASLTCQLTDLQLALCELYEGGGV